MKTLKLLIIFYAIVAFPYLGLSAIPDPPGGGGPGGGGVPVGAPIDGGMGILLALGLAYGGKKLYTIRKEKDAEAIEKDNG